MEYPIEPGSGRAVLEGIEREMIGEGESQIG
jgi:hypothetical protein